jgi:hypothetical protein
MRRGDGKSQNFSRKTSRNELGELYMDLRIISKLMSKSKLLGAGLGLSGSEYGPFAGCCEHGNKVSCSIKCYVAYLLTS